MYFFYVDETGNRDPETSRVLPDGSQKEKDWLYVLTAVSLFEHKWPRFHWKIQKLKHRLDDRIYRDTGVELRLKDFEIKSTWIRIPKERSKHPFLSRLTDEEITDLVECYYSRLFDLPMWIFSVIVDKRYIREYLDREKLHRKSWELLLERIEWFLREFHPKHRGVLVTDDTSRQLNLILAQKHQYLLSEGTSSGMKLNHIVEFPLFVRSELSNGIQLADLCSYNIYRAFKSNNLNYPFFKRIEHKIWRNPYRSSDKIEGLKIFPDESPLNIIKEEWEKESPSTQLGLKI